MKKYKVVTVAAIVLGIGLISNSIAANGQDDQRVPVEVSSLPEAIMETVQEDYEDYRISEAFLVSGNGQSEVEGVVSERTERTERTESQGAEGLGQSPAEGSYYEIKLEKDQETKTVKLKADGTEIDKDDKENIYVIENEEER